MVGIDEIDSHSQRSNFQEAKAVFERSSSTRSSGGAVMQSGNSTTFSAGSIGKSLRGSNTSITSAKSVGSYHEGAIANGSSSYVTKTVTTSYSNGGMSAGGYAIADGYRGEVVLYKGRKEDETRFAELNERLAHYIEVIFTLETLKNCNIWQKNQNFG